MKVLSVDRYNLVFIFALIIQFIILLFAADSFDIHYKEAEILYDGSGLLHIIITISTGLFGDNNIALRLPFILFFIASTLLLYKVTKWYFDKKEDRLLSIFIFMLLPGLNSASLIVNEAIIVVFFTLLYLFYYHITEKQCYILLVLFLFIDNSFAIFYLALFFYSLHKKDNLLLVVSLVLFALSMQIFGFEGITKPKGYFIDIILAYASIFSPVLFLYFFYSMYRITIKEEKNLYWYISFTAFAFSLVLSFRQRILIEDFAPFVVIAIPIMLKLFLHSLRVRLPMFRKKHYAGAYLLAGVLVLNFMLLYVNKPLYLLMEKPYTHFAYEYHFAQDIANELKKRDINNVFSSNSRLINRLRFYGISKGDDYYISLYDEGGYDAKFTIKNMGKVIETVYITKF